MRIKEENPLKTQIEYGAAPKKRTCTTCFGAGTTLSDEECHACKGAGVFLPPFKPFQLEKVVKPGAVSRDANYIVTIDDEPYAGFYSMKEANDAAKLWTGYVDGLGSVVDERPGVHWPAVEGRHVRVVTREELRHVL